MARFGDGMGMDADLVVAAEEAARQAMEALRGRTPDLVCTFVSGGDPAQAAAAGERVGGITRAGAMIGCSADGLMGAGQGVEARPAVAVWAAVLPGVRLREFHCAPIDRKACVMARAPRQFAPASSSRDHVHALIPLHPRR